MAWVGSGFLDPLCFEGLCLVRRAFASAPAHCKARALCILEPDTLQGTFKE